MNNKTNIDTIIKNGLFLTIDENGTIIENGAMAIDNKIIIAIDKKEKILSKYTAKNIIDASGKIVMPGFVNAHVHIPMTIFRGMADDIVLSDWLYKHIFPAEQNFINKERVRCGTALALAEMIHSGTTCFNDMYYFEDVVAEKAIEAGMRGIINEGLIDLPIANFKNADEGLKYTEFLLEKYKDNELISVGVGMHAPFSCSEKLMTDAKNLAKKYNTTYNIHVAETKWEFDKIRKEHDKTPVEYLDSIGILDEKVIAAHGIWLTDSDIELIAEKKVSIVHNPECNMKISSGVAPIPKLLAKDIKVGLGTDGVASNNNLNMIQELHTMALLHKLNTMTPTVLPAEEAVRIATIGSAKAIGKDKEIGSLETGKKADFIFIDTDFAHTTPAFNPYSTIVYAMLGNEVSDVFVNGKQIMKNYEILTIDEKYVKNAVNKTASEIKNFFENKSE